jgi:hypothetical protein
MPEHQGPRLLSPIPVSVQRPVADTLPQIDRHLALREGLELAHDTARCRRTRLVLCFGDAVVQRRADQRPMPRFRQPERHETTQRSSLQPAASSAQKNSSTNTDCKGRSPERTALAITYIPITAVRHPQQTFQPVPQIGQGQAKSRHENDRHELEMLVNAEDSTGSASSVRVPLPPPRDQLERHQHRSAPT